MVNLAVNRILVVTACGARKHSEPKPAWQLYKSPRVRAVYNRRMGYNMCILSAKYGLVEADKVIEPYEETLTAEKAEALIPQIVEKIKDYDYIVYFRGGAGKEYLNCMIKACKSTGKTLVTLGYKFMGGISDLPKAIRYIECKDNGKKYEIDSQWSQETELFCETIALMVKTFIDELNSGELKKSADFIEYIYDSRIAD